MKKLNVAWIFLVSWLTGSMVAIDSSFQARKFGTMVCLQHGDGFIASLKDITSGAVNYVKNNSKSAGSYLVGLFVGKSPIVLACLLFATMLIAFSPHSAMAFGGIGTAFAIGDIEDTKKTIEAVNVLLKEHEAKTQTAFDASIAAGKTESDAEVARLKGDLADIRKALEINAKQINLLGTGVPGLSDEIAKGKVQFSISKVIKSLFRQNVGKSDPAWNGFGDDPWRSANIPSEDASREKEIMDATLEYRKKASNFSSALEAGGVLIPQEIMDLIGIVWPAIPLLDKLPVTKLEGLVGDIHMPRLLSGFTAYQVGENTPPADSAVKWNEYVMKPRRSAALTFQSKTLMFQSGGASDKIVKQTLGESMANQIHFMLMTGNGVNYQPKGLNSWVGADPLNNICQAAGVALSPTGSNITTNGGRFTVTDALMQMAALEEVNEGNAPPANYGFLMRPIVRRLMQSERVLAPSGGGKGIPVVPTQPYLSDDSLKSAAGLIATSTHIVNTDKMGTTATGLSKVFYGNWKLFYVGFWADMAIRVSDQAYAQGISAFSQNGMFIIVEQAIDCFVGRPAAFSYVPGAAATQALA